jgi:hypothetical protein
MVKRKLPVDEPAVPATSTSLELMKNTVAVVMPDDWTVALFANPLPKTKNEKLVPCVAVAGPGLVAEIEGADTGSTVN